MNLQHSHLNPPLCTGSIEPKYAVTVQAVNDNLPCAVTDIPKAKHISSIRYMQLDIDFHAALLWIIAGNPLELGKLHSRSRVLEVAAPLLWHPPAGQVTGMSELHCDFHTVVSLWGHICLPVGVCAFDVRESGQGSVCLPARFAEACEGQEQEDMGTCHRRWLPHGIW